MFGCTHFFIAILYYNWFCSIVLISPFFVHIQHALVLFSLIMLDTLQSRVSLWPKRFGIHCGNSITTLLIYRSTRLLWRELLLLTRRKDHRVGIFRRSFPRVARMHRPQTRQRLQIIIILKISRQHLNELMLYLNNFSGILVLWGL